MKEDAKPCKPRRRNFQNGGSKRPSNCGLKLCRGAGDQLACFSFLGSAGPAQRDTRKYFLGLKQQWQGRSPLFCPERL